MGSAFRFLVGLVAGMWAVGGPLSAAAALAMTAPMDSALRAGESDGARLVWLILVTSGVAVGIMIRKDTATLATKFVTRAQAAAPDYKDGVASAGGEWEAQTKASEPNYEQGVTAAIARKAYGRGVTGSAGKYQQNAVALGAQRYGPGIANAKSAWQQGVEPAFNVLKSLQLPPKGPRRSPQNQARANAVSVALGAMKEGRS